MPTTHNDTSGTIHERIRLIIEYSGKSVNQFAADFGDRPDKYYKFIKGEGYPQWEVIEKIVAAYPEIDGNWLLKGEGTITGKQAFGEAATAEEDKSIDKELPASPNVEVALLRQLLEEKERVIQLQARLLTEVKANS